MRSITLVAALAAATFLAPLGAAPAVAAEEEPVTWSVRPSDASGEDGRSWAEWDADPGEARTDHMVVTNHGSTEVEFQLSAADGYFTDTGRFNMLPSDHESEDAGTWIELPDSVVVPPGGAEVVPFTVTVPDDATPGDHPAGVAASVLSDGEGNIGVESRVGFRVMTRVEGELVAALDASASGSYDGELNPFLPGGIDVAYDIENSGNMLLRTQPTVTVAGPFGIGSQTIQGAEIAEIAPGETRRGSIRIPDAWPLFTYTVSVEAEPRAVSEQPPIGGAAAVRADAQITAVPWPQLVVVLIAIALLVWGLAHRRREHERVAGLIAQAREEAFAQASAPHPAVAATRS